MKAEELKQFTVDELRGRIRQWQDELFRSRFKAQTSETKDTSVFGKLRKDIARGKTVLASKLLAGETGSSAKTEAAPSDKTVSGSKAGAKKAATKKTKVKGESSNA